MLAVLWLGSLFGTGAADCLADRSLGELVALLGETEKRGDAEAAAQIFDEMQRRGIQGGRFHLCQGNAYLRSGRLAEAIVAYRLAERWTRRDANVQANLRQARDAVLDPPVAVNNQIWAFWPRLSWFERQVLAVAVWGIGWGLACLVLVRPRRMFAMAAGGAILLAAALGIADWLSHWYEAAYPEAVVRESGVVLREGNGVSYPAVTRKDRPVTLNEGVEVRVIVHRPNGWVKIVLADGTVGWVPETSLIQIPPAP